jgi:hypothetical protein
MMVLNSILSMLIFFKLFSFFRASQYLAKMVIMMSRVFGDLTWFNFILVIIIIQSQLMYAMAGVTIYDPEEDFSDVEMSYLVINFV